MNYSGTTKERLDRIETAISILTAETGKLIMAAADLQAEIVTLQANVAADTSAETSAITLLNGLSAMIAALKAGVTDPTQLAAIDTLSKTVSSNAAALAAAVVANTPPAVAS